MGATKGIAFVIFVVHIFIIGGDALKRKDSSKLFENYEIGKYYVNSHGTNTEVSHCV